MSHSGCPPAGWPGDLTLPTQVSGLEEEGSVLSPACLRGAAPDLQSQSWSCGGGQRRFSGFLDLSNLFHFFSQSHFLPGGTSLWSGMACLGRQGSPCLWGSREGLGQSISRSVGPTSVLLLTGSQLRPDVARSLY